MTRSSYTASPTGVSTRFILTTALVLATVALMFAFAASSRASAQAHKTACTTHSRHGSHACSASKSRKGHAKGKPRAGTHRARRHAAKGIGHTPGAAGGEEGSEASCSQETNATADGEGALACANGSEQGCEEGFTADISTDGSALQCEPEASGESSGEEEG